MRRLIGILLVTAGFAVAVPSAADAFVYWTTGGHDVLQGTVARADLDGSNVRLGMITGNSAGQSLTVDSSHIYWGNWAMVNTIGRANLDGSGVNQSFIPNVLDPAALAVDGSHIYWAHFAGDGIGRANLDGAAAAGLISGSNYPFGLAVDAAHIYWSNSSSNTIARANLDGGSPNQSFITGANDPYGVAVDGSHIYWANHGANTIGRANLDGSGASQSFITGASAPYGLAVDAGHIYWTNSANGTIGRANLDGTGVNQAFIVSTDDYPIAIAVDGGSSVPSTTALAASANPSTYGTPLSFTATVASADTNRNSAKPTGTVAFGITGEPDVPVSLQNGTANYDPPYYLNVGDTVTVHYRGDLAFGSSGDNLPLTIEPATTKLSTSTSSAQPVAGSSVSFTATVQNLSTEITPFGRVNLSINGQNFGSAPLDENGQVSGELTPPVAGDYSVTVSYHDDTGDPPDFTDSRVDFVVHVVAPMQAQPPPTTTVSAAPPVLPAQVAPTQAVLGTRDTAPPGCTVPQLKGVKLAAAKRRLAQAHCRLGKISRTHSRRKLRGRVVSTKPRAGTQTTHSVGLVVGK